MSQNDGAFSGGGAAQTPRETFSGISEDGVDETARISFESLSSVSGLTASTDNSDGEDRRGRLTFFSPAGEQRGTPDSASKTGLQHPLAAVGAAGGEIKPSGKWLLAVSRNDEGLSEPSVVEADARNENIEGPPHGHEAHKKLAAPGSGNDMSRGMTGDGHPHEDSYAMPSAAASQRTWLISPRETALHGAIRSGRLEHVEAVLEDLDKAGAVRELHDPKLIAFAAQGGNGRVFASILGAVLETLTARQASGVLADAFSVLATEVQGYRNATSDPLPGLSLLLQHGTIPRSKDLTFLSRVIDPEKLEDCFFEAVASAKNSFIPSLNLSFAFEGASRDATTEKDRRVLARLQLDVDATLAQILTHLPQTVCSVPGGMATCVSLLEPETADSSAPGAGKGPLAAAIACAHRIVTFATCPLCMDFLLLKFTRGLPALSDGARVVALQSSDVDTREEARGYESLTALCQGSTLGGILDAVGKALCGDDSLALLTVFPGAHFIATGVAVLPNSYYKVPVMRLLLDAMVCAVVLVLYTATVLLHEEGPLTIAEVAFVVYILSVAMSEVTETRRGLTAYLLDRWKVPQLLALLLSLAGFTARATETSSAWGRGFYAVSTPLMYWRLLYYAQVLPSHGSTVQVLYSMASELGQFLVVMTVIMLGFSLSFFALFRDVNGQTFRGALLDVFQAMLGEASLFDEFVGEAYDLAATLLLVFYLVVMSIMLLNLLIAVLSTAHGKVEEEVLIRLSRARVFTHYRGVVECDALPAPFNVVQLVILLPCLVVDHAFKSNTCAIAKRCVGRVVFWLVMGPLAILGGSLLWLLSLPKAVDVVWRKGSIASRVRRTLLCVLWGVVGVPLCLAYAWVAQTTRVLCGHTWFLEAARSPQPTEHTVENIITEVTGVGMMSLRMRLKSPATSGKFYASASPQNRMTTVDDLRGLRKHLEEASRNHIEALEMRLERKLDEWLEGFVAKLSSPDKDIEA